MCLQTRQVRRGIHQKGVWLYRISFFFKRSLVPIHLSLIWAGLYLLLTMALDVLLPRAMLARPLTGVLVTLLMSLTSISLQQRMQQWTDRLLYDNWYDYRSVVAGLGKTLCETPDQATLVEQLVHRPVELMGLRGAALFLANESGLLNLKSCAGYESLPETATSIAADAPLAKLLSQETGPVVTSDVWQRLVNESLSHTEQTWLNAEFVQIWLPLVFQQEFHGVLVVGVNEKRGGLFNQELAILETLAHQVAPAANSFRLMETLRRQAEELALLQDELQATCHHRLTDREEERKRWARDLHDRLLQELFTLNIGLQTTARLVNNTSAVEQLATMRQEVIRLVDQVRDLCSELRPPELDVTGLVNAIRSYTCDLVNRWENVQVVGDFYDTYGEMSQPSLTITLDLDCKSVDLDSAVAIALCKSQYTCTPVEILTNPYPCWRANDISDSETGNLNGLQHLGVRGAGDLKTEFWHKGNQYPTALVSCSHTELLVVQEELSFVTGVT